MEFELCRSSEDAVRSKSYLSGIFHFACSGHMFYMMLL